MTSNKSEILFEWNEPWPYIWLKYKRDISNLFTLKTPQGIAVALAPLLILVMSIFVVFYRYVKDINILVPVASNLSETMTNAPLVTIMALGFGGYIGGLLLIVSLTLIIALLEKNITLYANKIMFGKRIIKYSDVRSFEINYTEDISVLTVHLKDKPELSNSPIDLGIIPEIDLDHLRQSLQNKVLHSNQ